MFTLPTHETKLPASDEVVDIQPLIVRDEKAMAAAKRAGSKADSYKTFLKILQEKVNTKIEKLAEVDLIHCMLHLRKISIGSTVDVNFTCPYTKQRIDLNINLNDIELKGKHKEKTIKNENFIVKLGLPKKIKNIESGIVSIQTESENIVLAEVPEKEKQELIDSLPINLKNEIIENLNDIINYSHTIEYESNQSHSITLRSAEDFFTLFFVM
tara:strand:- start:1484 stop:2122 length:639 start_codon:yes stop_codon:yes gene_type:complete